MRLPALLFFIYVILSSCTNSAAQQNEKISNQELIQLMKNENLQLVDVRTPEEVQQGMIEGAQNIDYRSPDFENNIAKLDRNQPIAVYCGVGGRSGKASDLLIDLGFKEVYDLTGGFTQWEAEEHPIKVP
jgi:rhodanese-related sulfurtransferase